MTTIKSNIPGFEDYYVTSDGKVFNLNTGLCLKPQNHHRYGYLRVCLCADRKPKMESIHRLVAKAYLPNPKNLPCVMHLDDNPKNNHVSNLRWATHQENMVDRDSKDRQAKGEHHGMSGRTGEACPVYGRTGAKNPMYGATGEKNPNAKLSNVQRAEIQQKYKTDAYSHRKLALEYGMSRTQIARIVNNTK